MARVVVYHDFDYRRGAIIDLFRLSEEHSLEARYFAQQMCDDLLRDVEVIEKELAEIKDFARRQLQRPYPNR